MTLFIHALAATVLGCWAAANWLIYVSDLPQWFVIATVGSFLLLVGTVLVAVFRRKWLAAAVGLLTVLFVLLPKMKVGEPAAWIQRTGFRAHASPIEGYLSNCKLLTISEDDRLQQIGLCASLRKRHRRIDIVYDTSAQAFRPIAEMPPELTAVSKLLPAKLVASAATRTHIFGSFYGLEYVDEED